MCLEGYLRCMVGEQPTEWSKWLALAKLWHNTNYESSINTTPVEVLYGKPPPIHVPYLGGENRVKVVDTYLKYIKAFLPRSRKISTTRTMLAREDTKTSSCNCS